MYNLVFEKTKNHIKCLNTFKRYIKFIESRILLNIFRNFDYSEYHHIIPQSMGVTKGKILAKNKYGYTEFMSNKDPRYLSGEFIEKNASSYEIDGVFYLSKKEAIKKLNISGITLDRRTRSDALEWKNWKRIFIEFKK